MVEAVPMEDHHHSPETCTSAAVDLFNIKSNAFQILLQQFMSMSLKADPDDHNTTKMKNKFY